MPTATLFFFRVSVRSATLDPREVCLRSHRPVCRLGDQTLCRRRLVHRRCEVGEGRQTQGSRTAQLFHERCRGKGRVYGGEVHLLLGLESGRFVQRRGSCFSGSSSFTAVPPVEGVVGVLAAL